MVKNPATESDPSPPPVVVLLHGIRTHGSWTEMVATVLESQCGAKVIPVRYGYFDAFRFLFPFLTRRGPIKRILRELRDIRSENPNARISVIAHSFGTYALVEALAEREIVLDRVIFCGSIVRNDFRRADFKAQLGSELILNDCGTHDIWPIFAQSITWGYGATGTFGFGTNGVRDRFSKFTHSQYFDRTFVQEYWVPFLRDGDIRATKWEENRSAPPWWQSMLSWLPLKYLLIALLCAGIWFAWRQVEGHRQVRLELGRDVYLAHYLGTPTMAAQLRLVNETSRPAEARSLSLTLISPSGEEVPMQMEGVLMMGQLQGMLTSLFAKPGETVEFQYSFFNNSLEFVTLRDEASNYHLQSGIRAYNPDPAKELLSKELTERLVKFAKSKFIWKPGKWQLRLSAYNGEHKLSAERSFTLTETEVQRMWKITDHYQSGIGVLPAWRFLPLDDCQPYLNKVAD